MLVVYSGVDCARCDRVKRLLKFANVEFLELDAKAAAEVHEGWRTDGTADLMAWRTAQPDGIGDQLPIIKRGGGDYENFQQALEYAMDEAIACVHHYLLRFDPGRGADLPQTFDATLRTLLLRLSGLPYHIDLPVIKKVVLAGGRCPCAAEPARAPQCPCPTHKQEIEATDMCGCTLLKIQCPDGPAQ